MGQPVGRYGSIMRPGRSTKSDIPITEPEFERRTAPDARMNLVLRFSTESGPRTIVASGIALSTAADIAREMEKAGHFAQVVDQLPLIAMADRIKKRKAEKQLAGKGKSPTLAVVQAPYLAAGSAEERLDPASASQIRAKANYSSAFHN